MCGIGNWVVVVGVDRGGEKWQAAEKGCGCMQAGPP